MDRSGLETENAWVRVMHEAFPSLAFLQLKGSKCISKNWQMTNPLIRRKSVLPSLTLSVSPMAAISFFFVISLICIRTVHLVDSKVVMVLMEGDPVISYKSDQTHLRSEEDVKIYKESMISGHDSFLNSLLPVDSYTKLYSYTHLLNGFALHITSKETRKILQEARGIVSVHEDIKMVKLTTHTPEFLGIPDGVWPELGGPKYSGEGVVIGMIDTGINPYHPSFTSQRTGAGNGVSSPHTAKFKGKCEAGESFPQSACSGKIAGAQYFARAAITAGDFNATRDYASPFDADGHGSHTASTAAGNYHIPVTINGFNYGYASGMAPGARIAVYKALYSFGGYMSDVVAAVDQAVEDGVDILSLSIGPSSVPQGPSAFLNILEMELLFATKAGVLVIQAVGNGGPSASSILSFSPWITSIAASVTDRKYNNSIELGNGQIMSGSGLGPVDVCHRNSRHSTVDGCQRPEPFIMSLARGKLIICTYSFDLELESASIAVIADTIRRIGAAGFILAAGPNFGFQHVKGTTVTLPVPGIVLSNLRASESLWEYYTANTQRDRRGRVLEFGAMGRIMDGRRAVYTGQGPVVASYSSRGPDVNNALLQTADVLKPNVMAPGSSIWAAWSPNSEGDTSARGQNFALVSGTSMATPHVAGVAALIKHKHPTWSPAAITSAIMTTADVTDRYGFPILAQQPNQLAAATPFDFGSGSVNATRSMDPGLVFDTDFRHYVQFLCAVPGVDAESVRRAVGVGCPTYKSLWCSDLNTPSVTVSNLVGSRTVSRKVTNVAEEKEKYRVMVAEPAGVTVRVWPHVFSIRAHASRRVKLTLEGRNVTNAYTFGEMALRGEKHVVRVPLAVYVTSVQRS